MHGLKEEIGGYQSRMKSEHGSLGLHSTPEKLHPLQEKKKKKLNPHILASLPLSFCLSKIKVII